MTQSALFEQLKHPNPHLRERAMLEIMETRDETTIPNLMAVLGEEDTVYRRAAVKAIGAVGVDTVLPLVDSLLNNDNSTVRSSCAKALAQVAINYPDISFPLEGIDGLKKALNDLNPVVHIASAMALGVIGQPALESMLEVFETTDNIALQVALLNAISSVDDDRSREILNRVVQDDSADIYLKQTAESALSRLDMLNFKRT